MIFLAKKFVLSMIIRIFAASVPTKPLNDAQMRGAFLYIYVYSQNTLMERLPHFTKHYMTEADLMALLKSRGLVISDEDKGGTVFGEHRVLSSFCLYVPILESSKGNLISIKKVQLFNKC